MLHTLRALLALEPPGRPLPARPRGGRLVRADRLPGRGRATWRPVPFSSRSWSGWSACTSCSPCTAVSARLARMAPLGLALPEESQAQLWHRVRDPGRGARPPGRRTRSDWCRTRGSRSATARSGSASAAARDRLEIGVPLVLALTDSQLQAALAPRVAARTAPPRPAARPSSGPATSCAGSAARSARTRPPAGSSPPRPGCTCGSPSRCSSDSRQEGDVSAVRVAGRDVVAGTLHELDAVAEDWHALPRRVRRPGAPDRAPAARPRRGVPRPA